MATLQEIDLAAPKRPICVGTVIYRKNQMFALVSQNLCYMYFSVKLSNEINVSCKKYTLLEMYLHRIYDLKSLVI